MPSYAQVTVGDGVPPHDFSVLEVSTASTKAGLRLPHLTTAERNAWRDYFLGTNTGNPVNPSGSGVTADELINAPGLMIYNTTNNCVEYWNTLKWVSFCDQPCADGITGVSISGGTTILQGATTAVTLTATATGGTASSYEWYLGGSPVGTTTANTYTVPQNVKDVAGTYAYTVKAINACSEATSPAPAIVEVIDLASLPDGSASGTLSGRTIFDIAQGNDGGACGDLAARAPFSTDFTQTEEQDATDGTPAAINPSASGTWLYSGTQVYTFTPSVDVSNVRFFYAEDASLEAIVSMTPNDDYSGNISSGDPCKAVVVYKPSLMTDLLNVIRDNAVHPKLYAVFNDQPDGAGTNRKFELTVSLQDCNCCGAFTSAGGWQNFLCYNLGANFMLEPFTPAKYLNGDYFQWGRPTVVATVDTPAGAIAGWNTSYAPNGSWSDASKTANDPCPQNYRVPTRSEWDGVVDTSLNPRTMPPGATLNTSETNFSNGLNFGSALYLPAAGYRSYGSSLLDRRGGYGYYWSSTEDRSSFAYFLYLTNYLTTTYQNLVRAYGFSVRCIAE
ncbi:hypothetical protein JCM30204_14970 [Dysgonomonas termitidis]